MEYYSTIKRNEIELFVVRWMDLESVIQGEVSQKEKNRYRMLTHIYGILKKQKQNGTDEPSGRAGIKTDTENGLEDMEVGWRESSIDIYTLPNVK